MRVIAIFLVALGFVGCHGTIPGPKTGPGTEMPCGALRVSCYPFDGTYGAARSVTPRTPEYP